MAEHENGGNKAIMRPGEVKITFEIKNLDSNTKGVYPVALNDMPLLNNKFETGDIIETNSGIYRVESIGHLYHC